MVGARGHMLCLSAQQVQDKEGAGVRTGRCSGSQLSLGAQKEATSRAGAGLSQGLCPATATRGRIKTLHQEDTGSLGAPLSVQAVCCHGYCFHGYPDFFFFLLSLYPCPIISFHMLNMNSN